MKPYDLTTLGRSFRPLLRHLLRTVGEAVAADSLGLNRATLARAVCGLPIRVATRERLEEALS